MTFFNPTTEQIRQLRGKDGPNFVIPQEYLNNLQSDEVSNLYFPIYWLDGSQIGWEVRLASGSSRWSQSIQNDISPRFTAWTANIVSEHIYPARKVCICEGPFDALAMAPIMPWTISSNKARVQREILDWCRLWNLHVFLALDQDTADPKTGKRTGQEATQRIKAELEGHGNRVR